MKIICVLCFYNQAILPNHRQAAKSKHIFVIYFDINSNDGNEKPTSVQPSVSLVKRKKEMFYFLEMTRCFDHAQSWVPDNAHCSVCITKFPHFMISMGY